MATTDLIDLSALPEATSGIPSFLDQICERFEFDYAAYAGTSPVGQGVHGHVNYPDAWKEHYVQQG
ncbi:MAG TPA: autoinducer binding domain-containing protein, partial [Rubellimicrobium sp.]|nr:autoinducer binding domain-containing protein [Rubellimicrobium sp.]